MSPSSLPGAAGAEHPFSPSPWFRTAGAAGHGRSSGTGPSQARCVQPNSSGMFLCCFSSHGTPVPLGMSGVAESLPRARHCTMVRDVALGSPRNQQPGQNTAGSCSHPYKLSPLIALRIGLLEITKQPRHCDPWAGEEGDQLNS